MVTTVFLAYLSDSGPVWRIFANKEAAVTAIEELPGDGEVIEDWTNWNVPEALPTWHRFVEVAGRKEPVHQKIDQRFLEGG